MPGLKEILTKLIDEAIKYSDGVRGRDTCLASCTPAYYEGLLSTAIKTAADQVEAQQREQAEKLITALDRIWTKPITEKLAHEIAGTALGEWNSVVHSLRCLEKSEGPPFLPEDALKELEKE